MFGAEALGLKLDGFRGPGSFQALFIALILLLSGCGESAKEVSKEPPKEAPTVEQTVEKAVEQEAESVVQKAEETAEKVVSEGVAVTETVAGQTVVEEKAVEQMAETTETQAKQEGETILHESEKKAEELGTMAEKELKELPEQIEKVIDKYEPIAERETRALDAEVSHLWRATKEETATLEKEAGNVLLRVERSAESLGKDAAMVLHALYVEFDLLDPALAQLVKLDAEGIERAVTLEIKEGETETERMSEDLLRDTRDWLAKGGHWVEEETKEAEKPLRKWESSAEQEIKAEEKKAEFWMDGRPLSDLKKEAAIAHHNLLITDEFPSAQQCAECHPGQYRQWSVSSHAYAQLSPVFNAMAERTNRLAHGTNADFCIRCHNQVGMAINEPIFIPNADRTPVTREGVSCIVCHRVKNAYGRVSGRLGIEKGPLTNPMFGPRGDSVLKQVIRDFHVTTDAKKGRLAYKDNATQVIHSGAVEVKTFATAQLCSNCHDVNSQNGFRLEEAYSQFRAAPAVTEGTSCQDCHMGKILGAKSGYDEGPIAYVGGVPTPTGKRTNHMFAGPDYTVVHPGIFPHHPEAESIASFREWLEFDVEAGWGTEEFEKQEHDPRNFPARWRDSRARKRGREFIGDQLNLISEYRAECMRTLRHGYQFGKFLVTRNDPSGIAFEVEIKNATNGHGAPTGFDAERLVFLQVRVKDRAGRVVFESGDRDPNGDVRDLHSDYVRDAKRPLDKYLYSLQSQFLLPNIRGGERTQILPVPVSQTPLVFLRPSTSSNLLLAHPPTTRKQALILPPLGTSKARYRISSKELSGDGPYTVELQFIAQMVPVNLINEVKSVGFDYGLSARELANRVVAGGFRLWSHRFEIGHTGMERDLTPSRREVLGPDSVAPALPWLNLPQSWEREPR